MAAAPLTPRRTATGRRRGRPPGSTNAARAARMAAVSSEPPPKRRKYIPGGPGGGGRFVDEDGVVTQVVRGSGRASTGGGMSRTPTARAPRASGANAPTGVSASSPILPRRERSTRTRIAVSRYEPDDDEQFSSAAAVAAAVVQSEGYKPREERGWEEFHPSLDIETTFMVFRAEEVDGTAARQPATTATPTASGTAGTPFANGIAGSSSADGDAAMERTDLGTPHGAAGDTSVPALSAASSNAADVLQDATGSGSAAAALGSNTSGFSPSGTPALPETPLRRRIGRPSRDGMVSYGYGVSTTPKTPKVLPIHNQTPKEKLDLKMPSYRKTDRVLLFESKAFERYVDKSMMNVGYQESDIYIRPERHLIKASDANAEEEIDAWHHVAGAGGSLSLPDAFTHVHPYGSSASSILQGGGAGSNGGVGRVEYDMDEQDDMWLAKYNVQRKALNVEPIAREIFEITITKIEKEWHALEKRIPKPNPKPPQTHRPRSSSAAAVNGETQVGEEQDSKCAICDDGDCENTNAIVFCDGCDLAVHQDCYGVPFIPEGQWLCRKCQLIGRGIPTCIFCPNTDGAFKQTNSSKWAHMLCAMWIPETSLGNTTFMEPVMDVDKVPKTRWRLTCYICRQKMGACIQCGNKACYQAFHVTCARRARLYLKMKNSQGALAILDNSMVLKAFCDRHCPPDYAKENAVHLATKEAKRYYKRTMRGRIWADSRASALQMAATTHAIFEHPIDESQMTGARISAVMGAAAAAAAAAVVAPTGESGADASITAGGGDKKKGVAGGPGGSSGQPAKLMWKLPSGAPVIPQAVFDIVETALQRFMLRRRREYVSEACRYWTLKREARRGAALLKRLQLQMETFTSMELTRRNFATMGPSGQARLERRIEFAKLLIRDLEQLRALSSEVVEREREKLEAAELEADFVDSCYFPIHKLLAPVIDKASVYDKDVFRDGFAALQAKVSERFYTNTLTFVHDLADVIHQTINRDLHPKQQTTDGRHPNGGEITVAVTAGSVNGSDRTAASSDAVAAEIVAGGAAASATSAILSTKASAAAAYGEARDRKRLGKRILRSIQSMLETALYAEADITRVPLVRLETMQKELSALLESCLELKSPSSAASTSGVTQARGAANGHASEDVKMADGEPVEGEAGQIVVAQSSIGSSDGADDVDAEGEEEEDDEEENDSADKMDIDIDPEVTPRRPKNKIISIEITTPRSSNLLAANGMSGVLGGEFNKGDGSSDLKLANGTGTSAGDESSSSNGASGGGTGGSQPTTNGPLTPPQSHTGSAGGASSSSAHHVPPSLGDGSPRPTMARKAVDTLHEGGILWYLDNFSPQGTTVVEEEWAGRDAVRLLSEDLTDMDEEELNGLEFDVGDNTITATPAGAAANGGGVGPGKTGGGSTDSGAAPRQNLTVTTPKRRGPSTPIRKGVRSSARRR